MLNTITLILVILTLGFGVFTFVKTQSLQKKQNTLLGIIADLQSAMVTFGKRLQNLETQVKDHSAPTVDQSYYDSKTNTLVIKGNVEADGWISAGKIKK